MYRVSFLLFIASTTFAAPLWCQSSTPAKPNIVFLFADDLGFGDLGCTGHPYARTPHLDRLAAQGIRFTQAYVTGVTCNPSRTGFMTGKFPASFSHYTADYGFRDRTTITQLLKDHGYATGHFGKWHIGPTQENGTYGIDRIASGKRSVEFGRDGGVYEQAIAFIRANQDRPFYLNVWGHITHYPVNPSPHFAERFEHLEVNEADFGPAMHKKFNLVRELEQDVDTGMRNYLGDVSSLDDAVGRLLATLEELGLEENTLVVFSSDHGPAPVKLEGKNKKGKDDQPEIMANMLGSPGPFRGGKHTTLEGGVRVPFLIRWPGIIPAGKVDEQSVISGIDWLPTLCRLTGIEIDAADFDGEDVSNAWLGKEVHTRKKALFWRNSAPRAAVTLREGPWKLYLPRRRGEVKLFDVTKDPQEQQNLADQHPEIVKRLTQSAKTWEASLPEQYLKKKGK